MNHCEDLGKGLTWIDFKTIILAMEWRTGQGYQLRRLLS